MTVRAIGISLIIEFQISIWLLPMPTVGRRLVLNIIDGRARINPDRSVYRIPLVSGNHPFEFKDKSCRGNVHSVPLSSDNILNNFRDISARTFANAVDLVAWWLDDESGKGPNFSSIGYIGPRGLFLQTSSDTIRLLKWQ